MNDARLLAAALADPDRIAGCDLAALLAAARAERLIGSLAFRLDARDLPDRVAGIVADARRDAERSRTEALWEAEMARRALAPLGIPVILLKGAAYHAAAVDAAAGRLVGDLDILVPRGALAETERALLAAGWERLKKENGYDDLYYRRWMHELPPLIHRSRDRMIDVHHTILPPTARPRPDAAALIEASVSLANGLRVLSPPDMIVHAAAHLFADGELDGGLRNLWDVDRLIRQFSGHADFAARLEERARLHQLRPAVARALRLSHRLFGTPVDAGLAGRPRPSDRLFEARLLARNGWGQPVRPLLRFGFYVRSHWLRMPPAMLARHLWIKTRAAG